MPQRRNHKPVTARPGAAATAAARNGSLPTSKVIVIGASAGGVETLKRLVDTLPAGIPAAIFIVLHISPTGPSYLPEILNRRNRIPAAHAVDGMAIEAGHIYVAPPDRHLLIKPGQMLLGRGPKENNARPAVDALFRTAAHSYGPWAVGVILSGGLDDGTIGLHEIKRRGGAAVVQDPREALFPSMPLSAMNNVPVDRVLSIDEMSPVLADLASRSVPRKQGLAFMARRNEALEPDVAEVGTDALKAHTFKGPPSSFTCPECGGALWELQDGKLLRYRCHVGHGYTAETLIAAQSDRLEDALWSALRALEENAAMRRRLAGRARRTNLELMAEAYEEQAAVAERRAALLRKAMMSNDDNGNGKGNGNGNASPEAIEAKAVRARDRSPGHLVPYATRDAEEQAAKPARRRAHTRKAKVR